MWGNGTIHLTTWSKAPRITSAHIFSLSLSSFIESQSLTLSFALQFYSLSLPCTHKYILAPANEHHYKQGISPKSSLHTRTQTYSVDDILQNKAYHSCRITPLRIPTKTYHYKIVQYNYNCFNGELCELLLVINFFLSCLFVNLGTFDKHTSVSAQVYKSGTVACAYNPAWTSDSHTFSPPPSLPFIP